jgi:hypothetical protein
MKSLKTIGASSRIIGLSTFIISTLLKSTIPSTKMLENEKDVVDKLLNS